MIGGPPGGGGLGGGADGGSVGGAEGGGEGGGGEGAYATKALLLARVMSLTEFVTAYSRLA